jgi:hypothetical protein
MSSCVRFFLYLSLPFIYFSSSYFLSLTHSCFTYSFLSLSLYRYIVFCFAIFSVSASGTKTAFAKNTTLKPSYNKIIFLGLCYWWEFLIKRYFLHSQLRWYLLHVIYSETILHVIYSETIIAIIFCDKMSHA